MVVDRQLHRRGTVVVEIGREAQSIQDLVDVGDCACEGHRGIGGAVADCKDEAGGAGQCKRTVGGGQRDLHRAAAGIGVADADSISVAG